MTRRWYLLIAGCLAASGAAAAADDDTLTDDRVVIKTEGSHRLLLPNDWPVQQQEGVLAGTGPPEFVDRCGHVVSALSRVGSGIALSRRGRRPGGERGRSISL